jgi:predicted Zn-ribbon and HTH transcriptional regulator
MICVNLRPIKNMQTLRKEIAQALEQEPLDLREISQLFRIREREVLDHLRHSSRSAHPKRLAMEPAQCKRCGFAFKKRERLSTPSRCPICKSESISPPRYRIIDKRDSSKT